MRHQVFIERCRDAQPETAESLARAIAERYGIDPRQILDRLQKGRFRVKANLDIAAARTFMAFLEASGALCSIVDSTGEVVVRSTALAATMRGRPMQASADGAIAHPDPSEVPFAKTLPPSSKLVAPSNDDYAMSLQTPLPGADPGEALNYESGLSAGFSSDPTDLGALSDPSAASSGSLRLSSLDGAGPETEAEDRSALAEADDTNAFLPPEMLREQAIELDVEPASLPGPPMQTEQAPVPAAASSARISALHDEVEEPSGPAQEQTAPPAPVHLSVLAFLSGNTRARFALGMGLSILLGFLVVSIFASSREDSRYRPVIAELDADYQAADTKVAWEALDDSRAAALETLESRRKNIVATSLIIWLAASGIFAFLWLRIIRWDRWGAPA